MTEPIQITEADELALRKYPVMETERTAREVRMSRTCLRTGFAEGYRAGMERAAEIIEKQAKAHPHGEKVWARECKEQLAAAIRKELDQ